MLYLYVLLLILILVHLCGMGIADAFISYKLDPVFVWRSIVRVKNGKMQIVP